MVRQITPRDGMFAAVARAQSALQVESFDDPLPSVFRTSAEGTFSFVV